MRALQCVAALCLFSLSAVAADSPFFGTWKLNPAKSKGTAGMKSKESTVVFEAAGNQVKRTATGIDGEEKPFNQSATIPWDGNEHKVDGPMGPAMIAVKPANDHMLNVTVKVNGKVVSSGRATVSADGKTMTSAFKGEDPKGRKFNTVEVFDKQ